MLRRVEGDERREPQSLLRALGLERAEPIVPAAAETDADTSFLPSDHPPWVKDALTVSTKARELLARLRPVVVTILSFWDHGIRSLSIGSARISIDPSGSYRMQ